MLVVWRDPHSEAILNASNDVFGQMCDQGMRLVAPRRKDSRVSRAKVGGNSCLAGPVLPLSPELAGLPRRGNDHVSGY